VSSYAVLEAREDLAYPADVYLEGSDQHRGWFQSSLLTAVARCGEAPYRTVLTHGFTVDAQGRKMSKSLGNVVAPQDVVNRLGADVLRLWVAATDYRAEMAVSDEILQRTADAYRRIRNTARYLLGNLNGFEPDRHTVAVDRLLALDRWALGRASALQRRIQSAYERFEFHRVYHDLHNFCVGDMGGFYLDVLKDRLYTTQPDSLARRSAQTVLHHLAEAMVRWIAPILSFTAEEIWRELPGARDPSVFFAEWYELPAVAVDEGFWRRLLGVREHVAKEAEALRVSGEIGASLEAEVDLYAGVELYKQLKPFAEELHFLLLTSAVRLHRETARTDSSVHYELDTGDEIWIDICATAHDKCQRCWHRRADVGVDAGYPDICGRCVENVSGSGETRRLG
jgi:isoleucyl-tRNA synthetase